MAKRKAPVPRKINEHKQSSLSWTMGQTSQQQHGTEGQQSSECDSLPSMELCIPNLIEDCELTTHLGNDDEESLKPLPSKRKKSRKQSETLQDANLRYLVEASDFYLTVDSVPHGVKDSVNKVIGKLGVVKFKLKENCCLSVLPEISHCKIYIGKTSNYCLYFEWPHLKDACQNCELESLQTGTELHIKYFEMENWPENYNLFAALRMKNCFSLRVQEFDSISQILTVAVWIRKAGLTSPSMYGNENSLRKSIRIIMKHFFGICAIDYCSQERNSKVDIESLYEAVKFVHQQEDLEPDINVMHPDLIPSLRLYQKKAIKWMLTREGWHIQSTLNEKNDCLYTEVKLSSEQTLFYNCYGGLLTDVKPLQKPLPLGGILADEMGLGKTVEVLACILLHQKPESHQADDLKTFITLNKASSSDAPSSVGDEEDICYFSSRVKQKKYFECICGSEEGSYGCDRANNMKIQCEKCGVWQHAECVKYDPENQLQSSYYCPHCWTTMVYPSKATLIVAPSTIGYQWLEEIQRHTRANALKVLVYHGVHTEGFIQPPTIADHDVVLMTYCTMRKEVSYLDIPHPNSDMGRRFRHPKRFMAIPSPLVAIKWWRICLDEAQMVECPTAKTAAMALRLPAFNRWCITGTPIQKHLNDLYGLLLFLGVDPYCVKAWWTDVLLEPYCHGITDAMHNVISSILWRTAKKDVLDQINIPAQIEKMYWLSFTPVEEHFYRRQHMDCSRDMIAQLNMYTSLETKLNSLDRHSFNKLLGPLLKLRQACCHPQVVRGQFVAIRKATLTMDELLETLIQRAKQEAEEGHRLLIASLNGLAAVHIIRKEWSAAVERYREVLQSAAELKPHIKTDKLQLLHALHNLSEVLEAGHEGIPATLRDCSLKKEANELHNKYLKKCQAKVQDARENLRSAQEVVTDIRNQMKSDSTWWISVLTWMEATHHDVDLVARIKSDLADVSNINCSIANRFRDSVGLRYVLTMQLDELEATHAALCAAVLALDDDPTTEVINGAVDCHLRPTRKFSTKRCTYCEVHELFNRYESRLFSFDEQRLAVESSNNDDPLLGQLRRGTWADSEVETVLKIVVVFGKQLNVNPTWIENGQSHVKLFEALKKEFRALRGVWMQLRDKASVIDELSMARIRLRLRYHNEPRTDVPQPDVLEPTEVEHHKLKLLSDRIVAQGELQKKLGQLLYLRNLSKSEHGKRGGSNPDPCPICQRKLGEQWSVLQCGHCFCIECIRILITDYSFGGRSKSLKCAICRQTTSHGEISYVNTAIESSEKNEHINVIGSHSTKVEAVIRKLIQIKTHDSTAKTLVFSTWQDVLDILANALTQNQILFCNLKCQSHKYEENLKLFKYDDHVNVLLMPVHSGANGLNLVEASHVILVEPILNPSSELQALGRVHRIGQLKPTTVHRFLIRGTIEERMYEALQIKANNVTSHDTEENTLTVKNLLDLFIREDEREP